MSASPRSLREPGDGVLARGAAAVYQVLVLELLLLVTASPGLVLLVLLVPDTSNAPLVALALLPVGPALSATLFAWRACPTGGDLQPARHFRRGYRANVVDVLRWWAPALCLMAVLVTNLAHLELAVAPAVPRAVVGTLLVVLLVATVLWSAHVLVLTSLFTLRTRDAALLGLHHLGRARTTLGAASLLVLAAGTVLVTSDWVLALLGSLFALVLLHNARPMIADVEENHTA
ncbi:glycosyl transferase [Pseudonocardia sp. TRM90224]|uniref:glycosyl transferase n=1 Tax=Pseudonocardia sp. TRM90224 TaxID=2812678 RepID=UPI001E5E1627|nr:glycosyl transferase [Pseudonocardia sp. TRM90224]